MDWIDRVMSVRGLISKDEVQFLMECAKLAPSGPVVDLGTFRGRSATALCGTVGHHRVITIDNWIMQHHGPNMETWARKELKKLGFTPRFVTGLSWKVPSGIDQLAMIFIDTDHRDVVLRWELDAWLPLLVPKGIVAMHDYGSPKWPTLTPLIDARFVEPEWTLMGVVGMLIAFQWNGVEKS